MDFLRMDRLMVCVVGMSVCQSKRLTSGGVSFLRKGRKMSHFFDGLEMVLEKLLEWVPGWLVMVILSLVYAVCLFQLIWWSWGQMTK